MVTGLNVNYTQENKYKITKKSNRKLCPNQPVCLSVSLATLIPSSYVIDLRVAVIPKIKKRVP